MIGRRVENRRDNEKMNDNAEYGDTRYGDQARKRKRYAVFNIEEIDHVHPAHDDVGVGDPHHIDHAENQVQAERQQRQHPPEQDAVDDSLDEIRIHSLQPHV